MPGTMPAVARGLAPARKSRPRTKRKQPAVSRYLGRRNPASYGHANGWTVSRKVAEAMDAHA